MRSRAVAALILLSILTAILAVSCRAASTEADGTVLTASEAKRWTSLFDRRGESGWLGADGIYSVSLDGNDAFGSARADTKTFFIFSDTLMGKADKHGDLHEISPMPAQSSAILNGKRPSESKIDFIWGDGGSGNLGEHLFGEHKWMLDCFVQGGTLYILGFPEEDWKPERIDMVSIPIKDGAPAFGEYTVTEDISELWRRVGDNYLYAFGIGITPNTESAGAADPDGDIYIYGYRDAMREMSRKDLIVGRIHESDLPDFSKFRYCGS